MKRNGASRPVSVSGFTGSHRVARAAPLLFKRYSVYRPAGGAGQLKSRRLRLGGKQCVNMSQLNVGENPKQRASEKAASESQFFEISPGTSPLVATTAPNGFLTRRLMFP